MGEDPIKDRYVILTGSRDNAGDFLIRRRTLELLRALRPDRTIIAWDAWKPLSAEQLLEVNRSRALILAGGPAMRRDMRPKIYPMVEDLDRIGVPILYMGIGWKSVVGEWHSTRAYALNGPTLALLRRADDSGYFSSVRDYHTLNVLLNHGFKHVCMTGCPALYDMDRWPPRFSAPAVIRNVSFSLGVSFAKSRAMEKVTKELILALRDFFKLSRFTVALHHSVDLEQHSYVSAQFRRKHLELIQWMDENGIDHVNLSTSAEKLIDHYSAADLHVGYRVHAHIFMSSIARPSVLIAEDGRGKALRGVLSGLVIDGYDRFSSTRQSLQRALKKLDLDAFTAPTSIVSDIVNNLDYEIRCHYPRMEAVAGNIRIHFEQMKRFVEQLP